MNNVSFLSRLLSEFTPKSVEEIRAAAREYWLEDKKQYLKDHPGDGYYVSPLAFEAGSLSAHYQILLIEYNSLVNQINTLNNG